jgi:hypothetical protein
MMSARELPVAFGWASKRENCSAKVDEASGLSQTVKLYIVQTNLMLKLVKLIGIFFLAKSSAKLHKPHE